MLEWVTAGRPASQRVDFFARLKQKPIPNSDIYIPNQANTVK